MIAIGDRYVCERELGRGGMATVMLARDLLHDRYVAIKLLKPELAGAVSHQRFLREVRLTAQLQHPHILPLYDSGIFEDLPFYVMPYIEGESLRSRLDREKQLPVDDAVQIASDVATALEYAHGHGVVHRDIKPENILLENDQAIVADFGIARAVSVAADERLTSTGLAVGTPTYMSPEQASGERDLGPASDIYSVGCVLFEMLAGIPPFVAATPQAVIARRIGAAAPSVRDLRASTPEHVVAAVSKALERVPADRFRSAGDLKHALERQASSSQTHKEARPATWRKVGLAALIAGVVASAVMFIGRWSPFGTGGAMSVLEQAKADIANLRLAEARRALDVQLAREPNDAEASLWAAQAGALSESDSAPQWRHAAQTAAAHVTQLPNEERFRAVALSALANDRLDDACMSFRQLVGVEPADLSARLSLADCMARDDVVVRDGNSQSGWRFRTDPQGTVDLYRQLLREYPVIEALRGHIYSRLVSLLISSPNSSLKGRAVDDPNVVFYAFPALTGDTVTYVPFSRPDLDVGRSGAQASAEQAGVIHNRELLREIAVSWVRDFPSDGAAHARLAEALENTGEIAPGPLGSLSALAEARKARMLVASSDTTAVLALAMLEFRLDVKSEQYSAARAIADSLLATPFQPPAGQLEAMAGLAAVTGHVWRVVDLAQREVGTYEPSLPGGHEYKPPRILEQTALQLYAYSALGAPAESIAMSRSRLESLITAYTSANQRQAVHEALLEHPLSLAAPAVGLDAVAGLSGEESYIVRLEQHLRRGDVGIVTDDLRKVASLRAGLWAGGISLDASFLESWIRASAGDTAGAMAQINAAIEALPTSSNLMLEDLAKASSLPRMLVLGADLAAKNHNANAQRWAAAVCDLWAHADYPLSADKHRMCGMATGIHTS